MENPTETVAELRKRLADAEKREKAELEKNQRAYIRKRDNTITSIMDNVLAMEAKLAGLKKYCHKRMEEQAEELAKYGKLRSDSKGGFSINTTDGKYKVTRRRDTKPTWDERSLKAIDLIKEFMADTIKKRDVKLYEILIKFLERNDKGDLEYGRVMDLMQHEDKFDDPRWKEGLRLIKESYSSHLKGYGYEFKKLGDDGKMESIILNFSSL